MQKKKKIYIAVLIISTVILIADIAVFFITKPSMGSFGRGEMPEGIENFGGFGSGEMPEGFENFGGFGSGEIPEGFENFSGFGSGEMPEGFENFSGFGSGEMPEGFENFSGFGSGEMPEGFDSMPMQGGSMPGSSKLRLICIPIAIICVIVDVVCGIGLFRMNRKKPKEKALPDKTEAEGPIDPVALRLAKKKRQKNVLTVVVAVLLIAVLLLQVLSSGIGQGKSALAVNEKVISSQVETGSIQKYLNSGGVLASVEDINVTIPGNVTITEYLVANGDNVTAGTPIATVDKSSVMAAIADIQEMMEELDDEMTDAMDESIESRIKATVDGKVVVVYAEAGESVIDVMYEHGSLALLSMDGLLAVELENSGNYTVGDTVTVTDGDGNQKDGQVASIGKDTIEVTVSLNDFSFEEEVSVTDSEGTEIGKGSLYIYSQQKITGYSGTISSVSIKKGSSVSVGSTLFKLTDTDYTAAYQVLLNKRLVLEDQYNQLVAIGNTGYLYADKDGMISGIGESDQSSQQSEQSTANNSYMFQGMSYTTRKTATLMKLSTGDNSAPESGTPESGNPEGGTPGGSQPEGGEIPGGSQPEGGETPEGNQPEGGENPGGNQPEGGETPGGSQPEGGETPGGDQPEGGETPGGNQPEGGETPGGNQPGVTEVVSKSVNVVWLNSDGTIMMEGFPEKIKLQLQANGTVKETVEISAEQDWSYTWSELPKYENGKEINYTITTDGPVTGFKTATKVTGSVTLMMNTKEGTVAPGTNTPGTEMPGGSMSGGSMPSGSMPSGSAQGGMTGSFGSGMMNENVPVVENTYVFQETFVCYLSSNEKVDVEITIDELDINSIAAGQVCEVTLDAFSGQSFEAVVKGINQEGVNSGGNTKYTVTVSMERQENMLLGMNVSVKIPMQSVENVLVIPEEALIEKGNAVYVYTEYSERSDKLSGLVEVTTGLSDGKNVEILSGLEAGADYYYRYADTISYTFL